jgi:hypothetical protein
MFPYVARIIETMPSNPSCFKVAHLSLLSLFTVEDFLDGIILTAK